MDKKELKKRYYEYPETSWGERPMINLRRYDCDTYFWINPEDKTAGGFVYCRFGYHKMPDDIYNLASEWIKAGEAEEISETYYREMWGFFNR
jgi:hypothetical protein